MRSVGILLLTLMSSPGALDTYGGHFDPFTGEYHVHAGQSHQFRTVDASGRIWTGNSPLPDEVRRLEAGDMLWNPMIMGSMVAVALGMLILYGRYRDHVQRYLQKSRARRHARRRR